MSVLITGDQKKVSFGSIEARESRSFALRRDSPEDSKLSKQGPCREIGADRHLFYILLGDSFAFLLLACHSAAARASLTRMGEGRQGCSGAAGEDRNGQRERDPVITISPLLPFR